MSEEKKIQQIIGKYRNDRNILASVAYRASVEDGGPDGLANRLDRAAMNQICKGIATESRYGIWASTLADHIRTALSEVEAGDVEAASKLLCKAANSALAFSEIQALFDRFDQREEDESVAWLVSMGFVCAGGWKSTADGIRCHLVEHEKSKNVLYAFVAEGEVLYVGKTIRTLKQRMSGYENPGPTQSTNISSNRKIRELLLEDNEVQIYVLPDNGMLHYGGFHVNLAAGLEDSIVRELSPAWNRVGK